MPKPHISKPDEHSRDDGAYSFRCQFCDMEFGLDVINLALHIGRTHDTPRKWCLFYITMVWWHPNGMMAPCENLFWYVVTPACVVWDLVSLVTEPTESTAYYIEVW